MFAVTPRLFLRPGWPEDAGNLFAMINDEMIVRNLANAPWPYSLKDAENFLSLPTDPVGPRWLIFSRTIARPQLLGCIGIGRLENRDIELGYWIARPHWGQGYATEAGQAVLETAKALGHEHLIASHFLDNPASGAVLRKLGFKPTGQTIPRYSLGRNREAKTLEYSRALSEPNECEVMRKIAA
ncbi:GNAT family N-acetyltransferase [Parasphingorhabdus sp.]|uniref:GNAT family N-acetyltransferase n=1 Tax=Parasphingorhabdus sp. TaxID=2709688 RepID=UPI0032675592